MVVGSTYLKSGRLETERHTVAVAVDSTSLRYSWGRAERGISPVWWEEPQAVRGWQKPLLFVVKARERVQEQDLLFVLVECLYLLQIREW